MINLSYKKIILKIRSIEEHFIRMAFPIIKRFLSRKSTSVKMVPILDSEGIIKSEFKPEKLKKNEIWLFNRFFNYNTEPIWDTDINSGFSWPKGIYFRRYKQVDVCNNADVKYPREISRCHRFIQYAMLFFEKEEDKYYNIFKNEIVSWIEENPFLHSINWGSTQDVAIRAANWIFSYFFFKSRIDNDRLFLKLFKTSLYEHGFYVFWYPENRDTYSGNHYLGDLTGQIFLGLTFQEDSFGKTWLKRGIDEFYREVRLQFLPSGPSYERSTSYFRLVSEFVFYTIIILKHNGYDIPKDIYYRMNNICDFIKAYTKPDGLAPIIGDQDDGRLFQFGFRNNLDHRYLLGIGSYLFSRSDIEVYRKYASIEANVLQLNKLNQVIMSESTESSQAFPDAGFYIIRNINDYMFINCSGKGKYPESSKGTHTHSDIFSFELFIEDRTFIVDPGSFIYSGNPKEKLLFRSTPMHNTLTIDETNQSNMNEVNMWDFDDSAKVNIETWDVKKNSVCFQAEHDAYCRLESPVIHKRDVTYSTETRIWKIVDIGYGQGKHVFDLYFHFDSGIDLFVDKNTVFTLNKSGANIRIDFVIDPDVKIEILDSDVSKSYGHKESSKTIRVRKIGHCPFLAETYIALNNNNIEEYCETNF